MLIGYARISTLEQSLDLQIDALKKAGCEKIFSDTISGSKAKRPGLDECLEYARSGDTIAVWKLDRLGRNLKHLIETVQALEDRGVGFKSLQENIDTTTPGGKLIFHVFGALAEFERDLIRERTLAGLAAARARGRIGGRKPALKAKKREVALALYRDKGVSIAEICRTLKISRTTFYRSLGLKKGDAPLPTVATTPKSPQHAVSLPEIPQADISPSMPPAVIQTASGVEQGSARPPVPALSDWETKRLDALRRCVELGQSERGRHSPEFQQLRYGLGDGIPGFSTSEEFLQWASGEVKRVDERKSR